MNFIAENKSKSRPKSAAIPGQNKRPFLPSARGTNTQNFGRTFFAQEQDQGDEFFRDTRVGSCRKVVVKNNIPFAYSFRIRNKKGEKLMNYKHTLKIPKRQYTTYQADYCNNNRPITHVGERHKPLVAYHPNP